MAPPKFLSEVGVKKWKELCKQLKGKKFNGNALAILCKSWEVYLAAQKEIDANGVTYTDTMNGRIWNNPAVNTADLAHKQIVKLSNQLGLFDVDAETGSPFDDDADE